VRKTSSGVRFGAVALALGFGALSVKWRRSRTSVDSSRSTITSSGETIASAVTNTAMLQSAFTGQPSRATAVTVSVLRGVGTVADFLGVDIGTQVAPLMAFDHPPSFTVSGLEVQREDFADHPVYVIRPDYPSGKYVVALHGGAYVVQPTVNHWSAYAEIVRRTHATVIVPIYPLASTLRGRAQIVIPEMADLISARITELGANEVSVYGDSAGGGMALAVAQLLVSRGAPTPSRMVLISPWLDVTMTNPAIASIDDPILRTASLRTAGQRWAGDLSPTDPLVSPLYGSLAGLPPTAVYCGNMDLLAADVVQLQDQARAGAASNFTFILRNGAIHDWAMGGALSTPESAGVQRDIYRQLGLET
jgi:triacylglycerol lipase